MITIVTSQTRGTGASYPGAEVTRRAQRLRISLTFLLLVAALPPVGA